MGEVRISGARFEKVKEHAERTGKTAEEIVDEALEEFVSGFLNGSIKL